MDLFYCLEQWNNMIPAYTVNENSVTIKKLQNRDIWHDPRKSEIEESCQIIPLTQIIVYLWSQK